MAFNYALEPNLARLQAELAAKTYQPGPYKTFVIYEPKRRLISAAPYRDRVAHHALCNVIEPIFNNGMIDSCYANRKGKGTHKALDQFVALAKQYRYCLRADIEMDFLCTWNFRHLANAFALPLLRDTNEKHGVFVPCVCTPEQLSGE